MGQQSPNQFGPPSEQPSQYPHQHPQSWQSPAGYPPQNQNQWGYQAPQSPGYPTMQPEPSIPLNYNYQPPNQYPLTPPPSKKGGSIAWIFILAIVFLIVIVGVAVWAITGGLKSGDVTPTITNSGSVSGTGKTGGNQATPAAGGSRNIATPIAGNNSGGITATIGQTVTTNGHTVTVNRVDRFSTILVNSFKAREGYIYLIVDATIISDKAKDLAPGLFFSLRDDKGNKYYPFTVGKSDLVPSRQDSPNPDPHRIWPTFDIPKDAKGLVLEYNSNLARLPSSNLLIKIAVD